MKAVIIPEEEYEQLKKELQEINDKDFFTKRMNRFKTADFVDYNDVNDFIVKISRKMLNKLADAGGIERTYIGTHPRYGKDSIYKYLYDNMDRYQNRMTA